MYGVKKLFSLYHFITIHSDKFIFQIYDINVNYADKTYLYVKKK